MNYRKVGFTMLPGGVVASLLCGCGDPVARISSAFAFTLIVLSPLFLFHSRSGDVDDPDFNVNELTPDDLDVLIETSAEIVAELGDIDLGSADFDFGFIDVFSLF